MNLLILDMLAWSAQRCGIAATWVLTGGGRGSGCILVIGVTLLASRSESLTFNILCYLGIYCWSPLYCVTRY